MVMVRHLRWFVVLGVLVTLFTARLSAQASIVFVTDDRGNVGRYDTGSGSGTALGSLTTNFTINQIIGMAFDYDANRLLLFDRYENKVYAMDATTGSSSLLFTSGSVVFQGGAVLNGLVYGIDENNQTLAAFDFAGVNQNLSGPTFDDHIHGLGVIPEKQELFYIGSSSGARVIGTDGTPGAVLLDSNVIPNVSYEDVAFFNGDYLVAPYEQAIYLVDGLDGTQSTFLNDTQLAAMGVTSSTSGVAVLQAVPEPGTWALMITGLVVVAFSLVRRQLRRR